MSTKSHSDDVAADGVAALSRLLVDTADRLRRLPESRLNKVASSGRALAQALADAAAGIEHRDAPGPPGARVVPVLSVFAIADQVAVTAHDLLAAAAEVDPETSVWSDGARSPLQSVLETVLRQAEQVRAQT